ncbi:lectin [Armillaria luteobubalina]|uniref:Lectin n=1 Tax=Armillaria luteobubalina TaxID=153913 RepID=A0AA39QFU8_9AGAR|nr:lectin [Armillaria luteobubalina]
MFFKVLLLLPAFWSIVAGNPLHPSDVSAKATGGHSSNALLPRLLDARAVAPVLDFSQSSYIWTGEQTGTAHTAPAGMRPFRVEIPSSATKCPTCATIIVAWYIVSLSLSLIRLYSYMPSDDQCPVYVNGRQIGTGRSPQQEAVVYTAGLNRDNKNVFAIGVSNTAEGSAGLIATIHVDYTDGTTETVVSDSTWKTLRGVAPGGWTSSGFDDSAWTAADVEGPSTASPWVSPALPPAINMTTAGWLQTDENVSSGSAPRGHRPFRKTFTSPYGKVAVCGKIVLSVEDSYTLYVNGKTIGTGSTWRAMQAYSLPELDPNVNVVAVDGANARENSRVWLGAGLLIAYNDGSSETYYTDASWKTLNALPPAGFEQPDADDSEWVVPTIWGPVAHDATVPNA